MSAPSTLPSGYSFISAGQSRAEAAGVIAAATAAGVSQKLISFSPDHAGYIVPTAVYTAYSAPAALGADPTLDPQVAAAIGYFSPIYLSKSVAGAANVTLTAAEAATVTRLGGNGIVKLTGAITANIQVILPVTAGAQALFWNATTGGFTVTLIGASGTGYAITQTKKARAFCDGTNWLQGSTEL